jgi:hypothetical protein
MYHCKKTATPKKRLKIYVSEKTSDKAPKKYDYKATKKLLQGSEKTSNAPKKLQTLRKNSKRSEKTP